VGSKSHSLLLLCLQLAHKLVHFLGFVLLLGLFIRILKPLAKVLVLMVIRKGEAHQPLNPVSMASVALLPVPCSRAPKNKEPPRGCENGSQLRFQVVPLRFRHQTSGCPTRLQGRLLQCGRGNRASLSAPLSNNLPSATRAVEFVILEREQYGKAHARCGATNSFGMETRSQRETRSPVQRQPEHDKRDCQTHNVEENGHRERTHG
jgi:hypothetical protein